jgi:hypothetical protein
MISGQSQTYDNHTNQKLARPALKCVTITCPLPQDPTACPDHPTHHQQRSTPENQEY